MATEELIVRAVRAGGDRQEAHERIRRHSIAAARAIKDGARAQRPARPPRRAMRSSACRSTTCWRRSIRARFVGRAAEQVDEFLDEVVDPLLGGAGGGR